MSVIVIDIVIDVPNEIKHQREINASTQATKDFIFTMSKHVPTTRKTLFDWQRDQYTKKVIYHYANIEIDASSPTNIYMTPCRIQSNHRASYQ